MCGLTISRRTPGFTGMFLLDGMTNLGVRLQGTRDAELYSSSLDCGNSCCHCCIRSDATRRPSADRRDQSFQQRGPPSGLLCTLLFPRSSLQSR
jgi:hypothetical protein